MIRIFEHLVAATFFNPLKRVRKSKNTVTCEHPHIPANGSLEPCSYASKDLVSFVKANIKMPSQSAKEDYLERIKGLDTISLIVDASSIFDRIFFGGRLAGHYFIHFGGLCSKAYGTTRACYIWDNYFMVTIYDQKAYATASREERIKQLLGTLLHEMIHVYLMYYECQSCQDQQNVKSQGNTGHGAAWTKIAWAIQDAVKDSKFLATDVDLGILRAMISEVEGHSLWIGNA